MGLVTLAIKAYKPKYQIRYCRYSSAFGFLESIGWKEIKETENATLRKVIYTIPLLFADAETLCGPWNLPEFRNTRLFVGGLVSTTPSPSNPDNYFTELHYRISTFNILTNLLSLFS
jgi:hypothetical protein